MTAVNDKESGADVSTEDVIKRLTDIAGGRTGHPPIARCLTCGCNLYSAKDIREHTQNNHLIG